MIWLWEKDGTDRLCLHSRPVASSEKVKKGDKFKDILAVDIPVYLYAALHSIPGATFRDMENSSQNIVLYRPLRGR